MQNSSGGTIEAAAGSELTVSLGLAANHEVIDLVGGTFDNNSLPLTNYAQITGYGLLRTGGLTNQASFTLTGGTSAVNGTVTNASSGTMQIEHYLALFTGAVVNNGLIKTTSTIVTYAGGFVNDGNYFSDPAVNYFSSLAVGPTGLVQGVGDQFFITAGSVSNSGHIDLGGTSLMVVDNGAGALAQCSGMLEIGTERRAFRGHRQHRRRRCWPTVPAERSPPALFTEAPRRVPIKAHWRARAIRSPSIIRWRIWS